jgi:hypothetical protein
MTNIVSGAVSTVTELGKDEAFMAGWLSEQPSRLGLGELRVTDSADQDDDRSFVAVDDDRCFSVDVQLGDMEASRGFGVLDNWARNRVLHPDKEHVAVLVTEAVSDRYQTTLETLAEHLPLVVVELQVWKGENEAIVIPHVALSSGVVDLSDTPAAHSAEALAKVKDEAPDDEAATEVVSEAEAVAAEADAKTEADAEAGADKDDTGVGNPWGLPDTETDDDGAVHSSATGSTGLLSKVS